MNSFYLITEDGLLQRANLSTISNASEVLRHVAKSEPIVAYNYPAPNYHTKLSDKRMVIARKLDSVNLHTYFAPITLPSGESRIHPVFYDNGMAIKQNRKFVPPPGHEIWFFMSFDLGRTHSDKSAPSTDGVYMCWHIPRDNIYRPPFSNTYPDGRICMGHNWSGTILDFYEDDDYSPMAAFEKAVNWFMESECNGDLRPNQAPIPLCLWNPATEEQDYSGFARPRDTMSVVSCHIFEKFFSENRL